MFEEVLLLSSVFWMVIVEFIYFSFPLSLWEEVFVSFEVITFCPDSYFSITFVSLTIYWTASGLPLLPFVSRSEFSWNEELVY